MVTDLWGEQEILLKKNNQRGITWKLGKGEQLFLDVTHCLNLIHIPIKLHEVIMNSELVMECTRM